MSADLLKGLDSAELQQLGINAAAAGEPAAALAYLKEAASRPDASAICHFLLGSEYAQGRLYERAVDAMEAALALDPALELARFQLGLLLLTMQELPRARQVLEPLGELGAGHALRHFGTGLRHLIAGEDGAALRELRTGLESGSGNPALDRDLGMLADALAALPGLAEPAAANAETDAGANADADADDASPWRHMLISAYTGKH